MEGSRILANALRRAKLHVLYPFGRDAVLASHQWLIADRPASGAHSIYRAHAPIPSPILYGPDEPLRSEIKVLRRVTRTGR